MEEPDDKNDTRTTTSPSALAASHSAYTHAATTEARGHDDEMESDDGAGRPDDKNDTRTATSPSALAAAPLQPWRPMFSHQKFTAKMRNLCELELFPKLPTAEPTENQLQDIVDDVNQRFNTSGATMKKVKTAHKSWLSSTGSRASRKRLEPVRTGGPPGPDRSSGSVRDGREQRKMQEQVKHAEYLARNEARRAEEKLAIDTATTTIADANARLDAATKECARFLRGDTMPFRDEDVEACRRLFVCAKEVRDATATIADGDDRLAILRTRIVDMGVRTDDLREKMARVCATTSWAREFAQSRTVAQVVTHTPAMRVSSQQPPSEGTKRKRGKGKPMASRTQATKFMTCILPEQQERMIKSFNEASTFLDADATTRDDHQHGLLLITKTGSDGLSIDVAGGNGFTKLQDPKSHPEAQQAIDLLLSLASMTTTSGKGYSVSTVAEGSAAAAARLT